MSNDSCILASLERVESDIKDLRDSMDDHQQRQHAFQLQMVADIASLKAKAKVWGMVSGAGSGGALAYALSLFG